MFVVEKGGLRELSGKRFAKKQIDLGEGLGGSVPVRLYRCFRTGQSFPVWVTPLGAAVLHAASVHVRMHSFPQ